VGTAWFAGLLLDVMHGYLLGANALAMTAVGYLTLKMYLRIRVFPLSQQSLAVAMILGLYHFILFWVEGIVGNNGPDIARWLAIVLGVLAWIPMQATLKLLWPRISRN
jgi:rod shape-determining protein MreD